MVLRGSFGDAEQGTLAFRVLWGVYLPEYMTPTLFVGVPVYKACLFFVVSRQSNKLLITNPLPGVHCILLQHDCIHTLACTWKHMQYYTHTNGHTCIHTYINIYKIIRFCLHKSICCILFMFVLQIHS